MVGVYIARLLRYGWNISAKAKMKIFQCFNMQSFFFSFSSLCLFLYKLYLKLSSLILLLLFQFTFIIACLTILAPVLLLSILTLLTQFEVYLISSQPLIANLFPANNYSTLVWYALFSWKVANAKLERNYPMQKKLSYFLKKLM